MGWDEEIDSDVTDDGNWFVGELCNGNFRLLHWNGWRVTIPNGLMPQDLSFMRSFCSLPDDGIVSTSDLGDLEGLVTFDVRRHGDLEISGGAPWFLGELREDHVELHRPKSWRATVHLKTPWAEFIRKLAVWSYLTGQLISPDHIGKATLRFWHEEGKCINIGKYPFIQFSISPFWCDSMN